MSSLRILAIVILLFVFPSVVSAQFECAGSLKQEDFHDQMKEINKVIQQDVIDYRKMQGELAKLEKGSEDAAEKLKKKISSQKALLEEHKKTFQELNSSNFPTTQFTVLGAACKDTRWVPKAKEVLLEKREHLGKAFFVWLDKDTREVRVGEKRPPRADVAP